MDTWRSTVCTYCKVRGEGPLLDRLVVGGLTPHQGQVEGQAGVIHTHHHGRHGRGFKNRSQVQGETVQDFNEWNYD